MSCQGFDVRACEEGELRDAWALAATNLGGDPTAENWLNQRAALDHTLTAIAKFKGEIVAVMNNLTLGDVNSQETYGTSVVQSGLAVDVRFRGRGISTALDFYLVNLYKSLNFRCVYSWPTHEKHDIRHGFALHKEFFQCTTSPRATVGSKNGPPEDARQFVPGEGTTVLAPKLRGPNQTSTRFIHEAEVGVKWTWTRRWAVSQSRTAGCLCAA